MCRKCAVSPQIVRIGGIFSEKNEAIGGIFFLHVGDACRPSAHRCVLPALPARSGPEGRCGWYMHDGPCDADRQACGPDLQMDGRIGGPKGGPTAKRKERTKEKRKNSIS